MHEALIEAAKRAEFILEEPVPFILQTSLDDYYVAYEINGYTKEVSKQAKINSTFHQNIQDVCNENGIEISSPHYRVNRDGNTAAVPINYLPKGYKPPPFNVKMDKG
jgi:small-conductance mechanosensitive channel